MTLGQQRRLVALSLRCGVKVQIANVAPRSAVKLPKDGYGLRVRYNGCWHWSLLHRQSLFAFREAIYHGDGHPVEGPGWPANLVH